MYFEDPEDPTKGFWAVSDCQPDDVACGGGAHKFLKSLSAPHGEKCPWSVTGTWKFCDGDIIPGGGCTHSSEDATVSITCL